MIRHWLVGQKTRDVRTARTILARFAWAFALFLSIVPLLVQLVQAAELPKILDVSMKPRAGSVELTIEINRRLPFLAYALSKPDRLVVDFPEVEWLNKTNGGKIEQERVEPFVTDSRFGRFSEGKSRLVVELNQSFTINGQGSNLQGPNNFKIIISLRPNRDVRFNDPDLAARDARLDSQKMEIVRLNIKPKIKPSLEERNARALPYIIVLDAGHGGIDPGAVAKNGTKEKDIVLAFAQELRDILEQNPHYQVVLTREDDEFIRLRQRLRIAKQAGASMFLSLHADSLRQTNFRGASVYTLSSNASDDEAERLAAQENKADILSDTDLSPYDDIVTSFLIDLVRRDTYNKSIELAEFLVEELGKVTKLVKKNRRFAGFVVLKSPETPSVLVEMGYLSNPDEARDLQNKKRRAFMAEAIKTAIDRYYEVNP